MTVTGTRRVRLKGTAIEEPERSEALRFENCGSNRSNGDLGRNLRQSS